MWILMATTVNKEIVTKTKLDNLANSISTKSGVSTPMTIDQMKVAVDGIINGTRGAIYQDEQGYLVVAKDAETPIQIDSLTVTQDGTYTAATNHAYNPVVVNTAPAPPDYYVKFIDYDGTQLYSYTHTQFNALSAMPSNPSHTGLVAQGWNWTLAEAKQQILNSPKQDLIIGQLYTTSSGNTQIDIQLDDADYLHPYLSLAVRGTIQIDWGDGSAAQQFSASSDDTYYDHEYSITGNYTIQIAVLSGFIILEGSYVNSSYRGMFRTSSGTDTNTFEQMVYQTRVKSVRIGSGVHGIYNCVFKYCYFLTQVIIPNSVPVGYSEVFYQCKSLKAITIPPLSQGFHTVPSDCFYQCSSLQKISLPRNIDSISNEAFAYCYSLQEITIPFDVYSLNYNCFLDCSSLKHIEIPVLYDNNYDEEGDWSQNSFSNNFNLLSVDFNSSTTCSSIPFGTFAYCYSLQEITIPSTVTRIYGDVFTNCYSLKKIVLPSGLIQIDGNAFSGCSAIQEITIPNTVTDIGSSAFQNCYSLKEITIPNGVTTISDGLFYQCCSLQEITIPNTVTNIGSDAFQYCYSLQEITIPSGVTTINSQTFSYCYALRKVTIPSTVTTIKSHAFSYCTSLFEITIPNSVTELDTYAFSNSGLQKITIPDTVTSMGNYIFYYCSRLMNVTLPSAKTTIQLGLFYACNSLGEITIPSGVTSIGNNAFYYTGLREITIPSGVTNIGNSAFSSCYSLRQVHLLPTTPPTLGTGVFSNINSNCIIYVPQGSLSAYQSATNWSTYASRIQEEPTT